MRHHTKDFLLKSPLDREHEMFDKINRAETLQQIKDLRLLVCLEGEAFETGSQESMLKQLKLKEEFIKD